ncbi:MAG: ABC transporter ATP-binding protein [Acidobacteria bacterium]|nr:ABC transporter ATP-binding protein [Acidobacteriota bacterium]
MTDSPNTHLLSVEHLRTVFPLRTGGDAAAVADVSFTLDRGQTLGLVGESGSGKSVTALSLIRLVQQPGRITSGRIRFEGRDLMTFDESAMRAIRGRRIGFVFQEPMVALNPVYTIGQQIAETLTVHGLARGAAARARAVEWLAAARVPDPQVRADAYPHQLSGGLRQRAMIALALCAEPSLVIADEPTTALDVTVQAEILDLLRDLRREFGLALLLITHDLGVVAEMADRVAVMYGGRIVEHGPVSQVFGAAAHPYTQGLLACLPSLNTNERLHAIPGTVPSLGAFPPGCGFATRCGDRFAPCDTAPPPDYPCGPDHHAACYLRQPEATR